MNEKSISGKVVDNALKQGLPGLVAMGVQVTTLMWLRTTVNYQYRYGTNMQTAFKTLYREGGLLRFYRGYLPAMVQAPISRFGDTATNAGVLTLLNHYDVTKDLPIGIKTLFASTSAGAFRILLMPIDTLKTIMQVEGKNGVRILSNKINNHGIRVLFNGSIASSLATFVGHYPWFSTFNYLNQTLPTYKDKHKTLLRSAFIGFSASLVSDTVSNSIRVIKTTKQTTQTNKSYSEVVKDIIEKGGVKELFGRGLTTKIVANGIQGLTFSVMWKICQDIYTGSLVNSIAVTSKN